MKLEIFVVFMKGFYGYLRGFSQSFDEKMGNSRQNWFNMTPNSQSAPKTATKILNKFTNTNKTP